MDAIGGGVLVAVAAALWIVYLLPTWLHRRQYLATERNAVRLQQTLRILAETAETPEAVVVEATAREVAVQQRILAEHQATARLEAQAAEHRAIVERVAAAEAAEAARRLAVEALATQPLPVVAVADAPAVRSSVPRRRALRRGRLACTLLLLVSVAATVAGLVGFPTVWPVAAAGFAAGGGAGGVLAFTGLVVLARRRITVPVPVAVPEPAAEEFEPIDLPEPEAEPEPVGWMPQPLPRPLHLSRGTIAAAAMASVEAAAELRRVATEAELAERAALLEPEVPTLETRRAAEPGPENPYAAMGVVDDSTSGYDLDAVLRRRRAVG